MKQIQQVFELPLRGANFAFITARNFNQHLFRCLEHKTAVMLNTQEMRKLGEFLINTANQIDSDTDFDQPYNK